MAGALFGFTSAIVMVCIVTISANILPSRDKNLVPSVPPTGESRACIVSEWSSWSEPFGFGQIYRNRKIVNQGLDCPTDLEEIQYTGQPLTVNQTAVNFANKFLRRTSSTGQSAPIQMWRDLLIIMDSSGSITSSQFSVARSDLADLVGYLCPSPDPFNGFQQAGLIRFASTVTEMFDFDDNANTQEVQNAINNMAYTGGATCTATAFNYATNNMFTTAKGMRICPCVKQEVLILTDGRSNCGGDATAAAQLLQSKAEVFGLIIGTHTEAGMNELTSYVSQPPSSHLFAIPSITDLTQLVNVIEALLPALNCAPLNPSAYVPSSYMDDSRYH